MIWRFSKSGGGDQSPVSTFAALLLVAFVAAGCVLWFMTVAMRNERLAVQQRLSDVYLTHLASVQRQLTAYWKERQSALQSVAGDSAPEIFATTIRSNLADSVIIYDRSGVVAYPSALAANSASQTDEPKGWDTAREQEFQKTNYLAAAEAYQRLAESNTDVHLKARALQAQGACLLKAGQTESALRLLAPLTRDSALRKAISPQGALLIPNVQLLILKAIRTPSDGLFQKTLADLTQRLNDYSEPEFSASQRRFLMEEVTALFQFESPPEESALGSTGYQPVPSGNLPDGGGAASMNHPGAGLALTPAAISVGKLPTGAGRLPAPPIFLTGSEAAFPTLAAEQLAAEFLELQTATQPEPRLQLTPKAKIWRVASPDRRRIALFRDERLRREMNAFVAALFLPDVRVALYAPGERPPPNQALPAQEAGELLPGWRLGLQFQGEDPFLAASERQTRFYLWIGFVVVLIIVALAFLAVRFVAAQVRLARLKNELVSTVSHELKTPLASMRVLVDTLLAGRYRGTEQLQSYLRLLAKENHRLSHLIENFLSFSLMERGKKRFRFDEVQVERIVRDAADAMRDRFEEPNCRLEIDIAKDLPNVHADAEALTTVLINLLENAHKYTEKNKRIQMRAFRKNGAVCLEVEDNGVGLTPREAAKVFDRFYQVDQSLSRRRDGCGLGLSIVQFIVKEHGGSIDVQSEPGQGSTFAVRLPVNEGMVG